MKQSLGSAVDVKQRCSTLKLILKTHRFTYLLASTFFIRSYVALKSGSSHLISSHLSLFLPQSPFLQHTATPWESPSVSPPLCSPSFLFSRFSPWPQCVSSVSPFYNSIFSPSLLSLSHTHTHTWHSDKLKSLQAEHVLYKNSLTDLCVFVYVNVNVKPCTVSVSFLNV